MQAGVTIYESIVTESLGATNQVVVLIEHEQLVDQGMGRFRKYPEYLLNEIAAELLAFK